MARVQFGGIVREASLDYVPAAKVGDYVLVHWLHAPVVDEVSARKPQ
jgi:hydrogenase expression/formation protein HypC